MKKRMDNLEKIVLFLLKYLQQKDESLIQLELVELVEAILKENTH